MLKKCLLFAAFIMLLAACKNDKNDMSQFGDDPAFQAVHGLPDSINFKPKGRMTQFNTPSNRNGRGYIVKTKEPSQKYLLIFHEWWGLNEYIQREADRIFDELGDVNVIALDMYDGQKAKTAEDATKMMAEVSEQRGKAIIQGALYMAGSDAKIATLGWCFGGGWSLKAAIQGGNQVTGAVMYYGMPVQKAEELSLLRADVLGIFAKKDQWITPEIVTQFEDLAKATGKKVEIHQFDADHAFANPSQPTFDKKVVNEANELAINFLKEKLK